jgi:hypothetical protein
MSSTVRARSSDLELSNMAVFIPGMHCSISGRRIDSADDAILFPPFVSNEADPLYIFSDGVFHRDAFAAHPLAKSALGRLEEARTRISPMKRLCIVCGEEIRDPDDYLGLGHLTDNASDFLQQFNYAQFHVSHLANWAQLRQLTVALEAFERSPNWKGNGLKYALAILRAKAT